MALLCALQASGNYKFEIRLLESHLTVLLFLISDVRTLVKS
jgi:hypothetical protein